MRRSAVLFPFILAAIAALVVLMGVELSAAGAGEASPSPSASASPSPTATPHIVYPTAEQVTQVKALRVRVVRVRRKLARVRACFGDHRPNPVACLPLRGASDETWEQVRLRLRHQLLDWRAKLAAGRKLMKSPPGAASGAKWMPLAKWVGWPKRALHTLAGLIWCESSGIKTNISPTGDWGLTQLNRLSWEPKFRQVMHAAWSKTLDPEYNLRFALYIWKVIQHGHFKPAWRGDKAVEAVE